MDSRAKLFMFLDEQRVLCAEFTNFGAGCIGEISLLTLGSQKQGLPVSLAPVRRTGETESTSRTGLVTSSGVREACVEIVREFRFHLKLVRGVLPLFGLFVEPPPPSAFIFEPGRTVRVMDNILLVRPKGFIILGRVDVVIASAAGRSRSSP